MSRAVIGWDVGGVNTKAARVEGGTVRELRSVPFEIQRAPGELAPLIARLAREVGSTQESHHAVTMTAELSQYFLTKREGVSFVLDAFESALPRSEIQLYGTDGAFHRVNIGRGNPLLVAASNWTATAALVADKWPDAVLVDIGTTTTDIIPVSSGIVVARGRTDPDRLRTAELLYLGALRTPVEAIVHEVPLGDSMAGVSAESFALAGDVYLWVGEIAEGDYTVPTPDGRAATRAGARDRLARVVCADRELLDDPAIDAIARHVARVQADRVARSLERVIAHHPSISRVVTAGLGSFIARRAAGLVRPVPLEVAELGPRFTPAAAVALLLEGRLDRPPLPVIPAAGTVIPAKAGIHVTRPNMDSRFRGNDEGESAADRLEHRAASESAMHDARPDPASPIRTVVKVGGALLGRQGALDTIVEVLRRVAERGDPVLVVPGGGPFADVVRRIDTELRLADDAAHWMAILGMSQYAELLSSLVPGARLVETAGECALALRSGCLPMLAPHRWLHAVDPLPHSWEVTSDSIAAWVAGELAAVRLVLVKAVKVGRPELVDPYFERVLSPGVELVITDAAGCAAALGF
jgi:probable H4MPT-linked C1 transfer pathway protein